MEHKGCYVIKLFTCDLCLAFRPYQDICDHELFCRECIAQDRPAHTCHLILLYTDCFPHSYPSLIYWRGHQTPPTVVSLKGRLPQKLQSKSTLSSEIVPIHSLFRHGYIKKLKLKFNRKRK